MKACGLLLIHLTSALANGWQTPPPPPPPPPPPAFMSMKGLPLACFDKPAFEEDGLEFFVCNGGGGLAGVRRKSNPARTVFVRDPDLAQNLNMQTAKAKCGAGKFAVRGDASGTFSFLCQGDEMNLSERFKSVSKTEWTRYAAYLNK